MPSLGKAVLTLATDDRELTKGLAKAKKDTDTWGSKVGSAAKTAGVALAGVGAVTLGVAAAAFKLTQAAAEEEAGMVRLQQAIKNTGKAWTDDFGRSLEDAIAKMARTSAFSDGELRDALATLVTMTGDANAAMKQLPIAMDFARGAGIDLTTASKLLGKVTDENVTVLQKYGITVKEGAKETDVLAAVQKKFGGQAAEFGKSAAGQWQIFQNTLDDIKEDLGAALLPAFTSMAKGASTALNDLRNGPLPGLIARVGELKDQVVAAFQTSPIAAFAASVFAELQKLPGFVLQVAGSLGEMFDVLTGRRPEAGGVLASLVGREQGVAIMQTLSTFREAFKSAFDVLEPIVKRVVDQLVEMKKKFEDLPAPLQALIAGAAAAKATGFDDWLAGLGNTALSVVQGVAGIAFALNKVGPTVAAWYAMHIGHLPTFIALQGLAVKGALAMALAWLPIIAIGAAIGVVLGALILDLGGVRTAIWNAIEGIGRFIGDGLGALGRALGEFFRPFGQFLDLFSKDAPYAIGLLLGALVRAVPTAIATLLDLGGQGAAALSVGLERMKDDVGELARSVLTALGGLKDKALKALGDFALDAVRAIAWLNYKFPEVAGRAIEGFIKGIFDAIPGVVKAAVDFAGRFLQGLKDALGIRSPSEETAKVGAEVMNGLMLGLQRHEGELYAMVGGIGVKLSDQMARAVENANRVAREALRRTTVAEHVASAIGWGPGATINGHEWQPGWQGVTDEATRLRNAGDPSMWEAQLRALGFDPKSARTAAGGGLIFDKLPRFHHGGIAQNEMVAVLERGEEVIPAGGRGHEHPIYVDGRQIARATSPHMQQRKRLAGARA